MNIREEERILLERRKALYDYAVKELKEAADRVEEFGKRVDIYIYDAS